MTTVAAPSVVSPGPGPGPGPVARRLRICLLSAEVFAWSRHGGFGRATRLIGGELARRGHEVYVVVPRRPGQGALERLDGVTVLGYDPARFWQAGELCRIVDADVYHSQEPSLATALAMRARPNRCHLVTSRDPREPGDWWLELMRPATSALRVLGSLLYEESPLVHRAVRRADAVYCAAPFLQPKVIRKYRLPRAPGVLRAPIAVPATVRKAETPTVCYVARWDRRKRPERFLALAERFPHVRFVAVGRSRDAGYERRLRERFGHLENVELAGFDDRLTGGRLSEILERSWVLVHTATREGLPNSFVEAAAHRCAILSAVDPDGFASEFGLHVTGDDFEGGLARLLDGDAWRAAGERAWRHVSEQFDTARVVDEHERAYRRVLANEAGR